MMTKPPCKVDGVDCPRRYVGCKAGCEKWHEWLAIHADEKEKIRLGREKYTDVESCMIDQTKRVNLDRQRRYIERYGRTHRKG